MVQDSITGQSTRVRSAEFPDLNVEMKHTKCLNRRHQKGKKTAYADVIIRKEICINRRISGTIAIREKDVLNDEDGIRI